MLFQSLLMLAGARTRMLDFSANLDTFRQHESHTSAWVDSSIVSAIRAQPRALLGKYIPSHATANPFGHGGKSTRRTSKQSSQECTSGRSPALDASVRQEDSAYTDSRLALLSTPRSPGYAHRVAPFRKPPTNETEMKRGLLRKEKESAQQKDLRLASRSLWRRRARARSTNPSFEGSLPVPRSWVPRKPPANKKFLNHVIGVKESGQGQTDITPRINFKKFFVHQGGLQDKDSSK